MPDDKRRISFHVDDKFYERTSKIPWGIRAAVLRQLLEKTMDAAEQKGNMIYGAVIGGDFKILYKEGK